MTPLKLPYPLNLADDSKRMHFQALVNHALRELGEETLHWENGVGYSVMSVSPKEDGTWFVMHYENNLGLEQKVVDKIEELARNNQ